MLLTQRECDFWFIVVLHSIAVLIYLLGINTFGFCCMTGVQERRCSMCSSQESAHWLPLAAENRSALPDVK